MTRPFDVLVAGLGAMGSAAAFHLASRGQRVLGLDRFHPPHTHGSSHGLTRIIREAYFEHPCYVPLIQRAYELWTDLQSRAGRPLLRITGGLMIGPPGSPIHAGALSSARQHRLPHQELTAAEVRRRFPALQPTDDLAAVWEPRAGILFPESCLDAHLAAARNLGAELRFGEPMLEWTRDGEGLRIRTDRDTYLARSLVLCLGAWAPQTLATFQPRIVPLQVERQVLFWFEAARAAESFGPTHCPVHLWQAPEGEYFYGFPDLGDGIKVARHHSGTPTTPDTLQREVTPGDEASMRRHVQRFLPAADGRFRSAAVCLYTNTPDSHFWIDRLPGHPNIVVASPCSGHGFKFASVIGEIVADEIMAQPSRFDMSLFRTRAFPQAGS
jgi:sarcosine oxidase